MFTRSTPKWPATAACAMAPASLLLAALGGGHALLIGILALATGAVGILLRRQLLRE